MANDSFPRQFARTQRLTLGIPRNLTVDARRNRVWFLRSDSGSTGIHHLWSADLDRGEATKVVDATELQIDDSNVPAAERARRERLREGAGGITDYSLDANRDRAVFSLGGRLITVDLMSGQATPIDVAGPVFDPQISPDGSRIGFVRERSLVVTDLDGNESLVLAEDDPHITWGSADFVAAEEMRRLTGFWWSPDSSQLAVCRNDDREVTVWHISNPADPAQPGVQHRYPAAGTTNPAVELYVVDVATGDRDASRGASRDGVVDPRARRQVDWDRAAFEYLAKVSWGAAGLLITVQSRDQRTLQIRTVNPADGGTELAWVDTDPHWVELVPGSGVMTAAGTLITAADREGHRRILVDDTIVTPSHIQVRAIIAATDDHIIFEGNELDDPTSIHVYQQRATTVTDPTTRLTTEPGIHTAAVDHDTIVIRRSNLANADVDWILPRGARLETVAETPLVVPNVTLIESGADRLSTAVLLPHNHDGSALPVLLDPYGGPHAQRVIQSYRAMCASQWFADQGFAVVVCDGRGTPGRGTAFERAVHHDLANGVLNDQIDALQSAKQQFPLLDLERVAIRGWSFGGYLAALAVLQRPDVFHAAIAGAPVTEWRLYDTHYTERYLGDPNDVPAVYDANSLLPLASNLIRPLLLIHGLADDNVVAAHSLQLSAALLAAGRPHQMLPLVGITHITPQEVVAENLLQHQLWFLRSALGLTTVGPNE